MTQVTNTDSTPDLDLNRKVFNRRLLVESALIFVVAGFVLFLLNTRIVNVFDEGISLTGSMQVAAGEVMHRDFNYNYGPFQLYLVAGLFKLFGPSVLLERLADIVSNCCLLVTLYLLARKFCDRLIAASAALFCVLWLIGAAVTLSLMNPAICMFALWASWLILPIDNHRLQRRRALTAGVLAALTFLCRYDSGMGTIAANLSSVVILWLLQKPGARVSPRRLVTTVIGPYLLAFVIVVLPPAIAYLSVAPLHDLLYDVVIYMAKYYRLGRALPFPRPHLGAALGESGIYLLPPIIALGLWMAARRVFARQRQVPDASVARTPEWVMFLVSLSVTAAMFTSKGLVRISLGSMYAGIICCVLLLAILFQHRKMFSHWLSWALTAVTVLFFVTAASAVRAQLFAGDSVHLRPLVINWILTPNRQPPSPAFRSWCQDGTPITRGFCYLLDENHIQTIRYLAAHTTPNDYLYVGLDHHDRIILNDMITYFAVQRLPAVRWTEDDPFIENRADVQVEMIAGLEQHEPPYVVLDSEFDNLWEPNGSSVSTGVHLLDDYIAAHYKTVQQYGKLTILRRQG